MIPGFNHNIKHKGRVYHIQTEDSGPKNPHIITHLFVGGNILASKKTEYTEILGKTDYEKTVRSMMEEQHKQMLRNLVNGIYDNVANTSPAYALDGPAPVNFTATSPTTSSMAGAAAFKGLPSQAARASQPPSVARTATPAPAPLDFQRPVGGIAVSGTPLQPTPEPPPPEVIAAQQDRLATAAAHAAKGAGAAAAPAGIFGEDLISEKSLDEVILGYLSEDLVDPE